MKPKLLDIIALIFALFILTVVSLAAYRNPGGKTLVHIKAFQGEWYYPLDEEQEISVTGGIGATIIAIGAGKAHVVSSPCRGKICVLQGNISQSGEWIACLPNSVLITIEAQENANWDSISF